MLTDTGIFIKYDAIGKRDVVENFVNAKIFMVLSIENLSKE